MYTGLSRQKMQIKTPDIEKGWRARAFDGRSAGPCRDLD
jgi:hypothetical protein